MQKFIELTNKHIVLATPLILFSLVTSLYLAGALGSKIINVIIALGILLLMTAVFIAGWGYIIKLAVERDSGEPYTLLKEFSAGVGEYFLSALGIGLVSIIVMALVSIIAFYLGMHFIGNPDISLNDLIKSSQSVEATKTFLLSLTSDQLKQLSSWNLHLMGATLTGYLLLFLYLPAVFFINKNPFVAFFISLKNLFSKKFLKTIGVFVLIFIANTIISMFAYLTLRMPAINFIFTLLNFYVLTASALGLFYYYHTNFTNKHLGKLIDINI